MNQAIPLSPEVVPGARVVNWPRVGLYIGLTFSVTWLFNLGLYLSGGLAVPATAVALVTQMMLPAFFAILLETFVFTNSPLYFKVYRGPARWFTYFYLGATILMVAGTIAALAAPGLVSLLATVQAVLVVLGALVIVVVRWRGGKHTYAGAGMAGGRFHWWLILGLGLVAYYGLSALLNTLFNLGVAVDMVKIMPQQAAAGWSPLAIQGVMLLNTILLGPFLNMLRCCGATSPAASSIFLYFADPHRHIAFLAVIPGKIGHGLEVSVGVDRRLGYVQTGRPRRPPGGSTD